MTTVTRRAHEFLWAKNTNDKVKPTMCFALIEAKVSKKVHK